MANYLFCTIEKASVSVAPYHWTGDQCHFVQAKRGLLSFCTINNASYLFNDFRRYSFIVVWILNPADSQLSLRTWAMPFKNISLPFAVKWTLSLKNSSGLSKRMYGWGTVLPLTHETKVAITLLTNFRTLSIFSGGACLHWRLWLMEESMIFIWGNCWWRSCRSLFIALRSSTLFTHPRSFPPQWITSTSGAILLLRHVWKKGRRSSQRMPPLPNHWMWADTPRLVPMVSFARSSPRRM